MKNRWDNLDLLFAHELLRSLAMRTETIAAESKQWEVANALNWKAQVEHECQQKIDAMENFYERYYHNEISDRDSKIQSLSSKVKQLGDEFQALQQYNETLQQRLASIQTKGKMLLQYGDECDLYENEIASFVHKTLKFAFDNQAYKHSRYQHILQDLLAANPIMNDVRKKKEKTLHQIMHDYIRMDSVTRQAITTLGFNISEEGAHYKLVFLNDSRYTYSVSKTSSDNRAGKNFARDTANMLF